MLGFRCPPSDTPKSPPGFLRWVLWVLLVAVSTPGWGQPLSMLRAQGTSLVDAAGKPVVLRGFNVGGWLLQESYILKTDSLDSQARIRRALLRTMSDEELEAFYARFRANFVTKADIDFLAAQGFNCVRLPFHYDLFLTREQRRARGRASQNPANVPAYVQALAQWYDQNQLFTDAKGVEGFRLIDQVLDWCAANRMYVVLDLHAAPGGQGADRNINDNLMPLDLWKRRDAKGRLIYQDITVRLWQKLSARYRLDPRVAMYDLLNEPHKVDAEHGLSAGNQEINTLYSRLINAVRDQQDSHLILLEGNGYGNEYTNLTPGRLRVRNQTNLVYNAHRYWCSNNPQATDANPLQINLIHNLVAFRDQWQVPVWVGETGENSNEWFAAAVQGLNQAGIGWCHWTLKRVEGASSLLRVRDYGSILTPQGRAALLRNCQIGACVVNRDVVAAFAPTSSALQPFSPQRLPGVIAAADYDLGRHGVAYQDEYAERTDYRNHIPTNGGNAYRNDGVDIFPVADSAPSSGFAVADMGAGEWLNYTVEVQRGGPYTLQARLATTAPTARLLIRLDGQLIGTLYVTKTANPAAWSTISTTTPALPTGRHVLQVAVAEPGAQLGWLRFEPAAAAPQGE